ncbi:hypothetical protein ACTGXY_04570 [Streptococcus suis]
MKIKLLYALLILALGAAIMTYFSTQDKYFDLINSKYILQQLGIE